MNNRKIKIVIAIIILILLIIFVLFLVGTSKTNTDIKISENKGDIADFVELEGINKPKLVDGMIAVKWVENDWVEISDPNSDTTWYDYKEQIGLTDGKTSQWANAKTKDGSIWVWIPRYAYKISDDISFAVPPIDIIFLKGNTNTVANGTEISKEYKVHPSFVNNVDIGGWDSEITGFWVSKYEAGFAVTEQGDMQVESKITFSGEVENNYYGTVKSELTKIVFPVFKANKYSYNNINIGSSYDISKALNSNGNPYGLNLNDSDSHMIKNSEWGCIAYLSHSKYGRNGIELKVNESKIVTGTDVIYAVTAGGNGKDGLAKDEKEAIMINSDQSTTGNVYGVYDISGGLWERVSAYINNGNENLLKYGKNILEDGLAQKSSKYKTVYNFDNNNDDNESNYNLENNKIINGDAIFETSNGIGSKSWFGDYSSFMFLDAPWLHRGGTYSNTTGVGAFAFSNTGGKAYKSLGFRCVITPM
ncbi:MAG: hypothetical protein PHD15_04955 [Clostridia bacterium]|nr:hypothetical protein [Clostridia bacterium]MDD4387089.1 hypothetical protein [Clostridia bacterium]